MKIKSFLLIILITSLLISTACSSKPNPISDEEMIFIQINFNDSLNPILEEMTEVYGDYISHNSSENRFKSQIESLKEQYKDIDKAYLEFKKKYYLENHSQEIEEMVKNMEGARASIWLILNNSIDKGRALDKDELLKLYVENLSIYQNELENLDNIIKKRQI